MAATTGGLPDQIPPQGAPFVYLDGEGHYRLETDWYLFLYFVGTQIAAVQSGGSPLPPALNIAFADLDALGADIAQVARSAQNALILAQDSLLQDASTGTGGGITAGTGDVTFSGTGSVATTIALGVEHAWTSTQYVTNTPLTDASTITPNVSTSTNNFYLLTTTAVGSSRTMALPTGVQPGMVVNIQVKQPSSGGPCAIAWAAGYLWGQGGSSTAPIPSQTASAVELYSFIVQQDLNLHGVMIGQSGPAGAGYGGTSTTSQGTGTGSKTFTTQAGKAWQVGAYVRYTSTGTGEYMQGTVTAYSIASMTINVDTNTCTTTHTDWNINPAGVQGATGSAGTPGSSNFAGTSVTSNTIGTGSLTFTTQAGLAYQVGARIRIADSAATTNYVEGICTAYSGTTLTINSDTFGGSGTFATWNLNIAGNPGAVGSYHGFSAWASAATSITSGTPTKILFATVEFDTGSEFASSRFTPTVAGLYQFNAASQVGPGTTAGNISLYKNGARYKAGAYTPPNGGYIGSNLATVAQANGTTDYFEIYGEFSGAGMSSFNRIDITFFNGCQIK